MKGHVNKSRGIMKLSVNGRIIEKRIFQSRVEKELFLKKWTSIFNGIETKGLVHIDLLFYCYNYRRVKKQQHAN